MAKTGKYIVCPKCKGEGVLLHPAFRGQWDQDLVEDSEFRDEIEHGVHNVSCETCKGKRVVTCDKLKQQNENNESFHEQWNEICREELMLGNIDYINI